MQRQLGILRGSVVEHANVGGDNRIEAGCGGAVDGLLPRRPTSRLRVGVQSQEGAAATRVRIGDTVMHVALAEIEPLEVARVGGVAESQVDRVRPGVDGGLQ